jgi:hypothetical protein
MFNIKKSNLSNYCKSSFVVLFVAAIFNVGYAAQPIIGVAPTVLVESSSEVIPSDLSASNLPKTISLGWETEAEILELKRQLVEFNLVGPKTCMSWFYMRIGNRTKLFMISPFDVGILRVNNKNFDFRGLRSYLEASSTSANLHDIFRGPQIFYDRSMRIPLEFFFSDINSIVKSRKDVACTFTNVKCRKYEFSTFPGVFLVPAENVEGQVIKAQRLVIKNAITKPVSFFAEDMCPKTSNALIEVSTRLRLGDTGEFINSLSGGIPFNRDIKKALIEDLKK